jgi:hypothetical protein
MKEFNNFKRQNLEKSTKTLRGNMIIESSQFDLIETVGIFNQTVIDWKLIGCEKE